MDGTPRTFWTGPNLPGSFQKEKPPWVSMSGASVKCIGIVPDVKQSAGDCVSLSLSSSCASFLKEKIRFCTRLPTVSLINLPCMEVQSCKYENAIKVYQKESKYACAWCEYKIIFVFLKNLGVPPGN